MSDITEQKETQQRLEESERLRTLGMLAGGIAHDLNNLLAPILGFSDLLTKHPEQVVGAVETIREASERAQKLTHRLLEFSRPRGAGDEPVCLRRIVEMSLQWVSSSLPANVSTAVELDADSTVVFGDVARLEAMVMNLLSNAGHAMREHGGTIHLRLSNPQLDVVQLMVCDGGPGIRPADQDRIFEPFFTTRPPEQGCGLGLYMVRNTVESMGGSICVDSSPGEGACFAISLDCAEFVNTDPVQGDVRVAAGESLRVLVVDDQVAMLNVCEAMLHHLGHDCELVSRAEDALERAGPDFDVVLSDYRIGGSSGLELVGDLRHSGLPVILMSGHFDGTELASGGVVATLDKPFDIDALERALQSVPRR